jgi:hypothetical protein
MLSRGEAATDANFIVFGLTRTGFEPMNYGTQDEHANYYTTDVVPLKRMGGLLVRL